MRKYSYYLPLDEDIFEDPEVQLFIEEMGKAAFLDYIHLLLIMRDHKSTDFMIPMDFLPVVAKRSLWTPEDELRKTVAYCVKLGWLKVHEDEVTKVKYLYSERRQCDLRTWQVKSERRSEAGRKGNEIRWGKKDSNTTENEDESFNEE